MKTGTLTLGQALALARTRSGLTQQELGEKIGMSKRSVQEWERDAISPLRHLGKIEEALGVPEGRILDMVDPFSRLDEIMKCLADIRSMQDKILKTIEQGKSIP